MEGRGGPVGQGSGAMNLGPIEILVVLALGVGIGIFVVRRFAASRQ
jgi:hypothetical protein